MVESYLIEYKKTIIKWKTIQKTNISFVVKELIPKLKDKIIGLRMLNKLVGLNTQPKF